MRAGDILLSMVLHPEGDVRHEPGMVIDADGDGGASGRFIDRDGHEWFIRIQDKKKLFGRA